MKHKRTLVSIAMVALVLVSLCAVGASALSVSSNAQAAGLVGAPVGVGAPAVVAVNNTTVNLFIRGDDNALYAWNGSFNATTGNWTWSTVASLGGNLTSDPAAALVSNGHIGVLMRGPYGALWAMNSTTNGTSWNASHSLGGQIAPNTGPSICEYSSGNYLVFVQGTDGALWYKARSGGVWSDWQSLGGKLTSSPAATALLNSNRIDVFVRGTDGALYEKILTDNGTTVSDWTSLGGQLASGTGPASDARGLNGLDVFVKGTNQTLNYMRWNGTAWSAWTSLGGNLTSSPAATSPGNGTVDVFVRNGSTGLWEKTTVNNATSWSSWISLGNAAAATSQGTPGFEVTLALVGLIIVAYVVRRGR